MLDGLASKSSAPIDRSKVNASPVQMMTLSSVVNKQRPVKSTTWLLEVNKNPVHLANARSDHDRLRRWFVGVLAVGHLHFTGAKSAFLLTIDLATLIFVSFQMTIKHGNCIRRVTVCLAKLR